MTSTWFVGKIWINISLKFFFLNLNLMQIKFCIWRAIQAGNTLFVFLSRCLGKSKDYRRSESLKKNVKRLEFGEIVRDTRWVLRTLSRGSRQRGKGLRVANEVKHGKGEDGSRGKQRSIGCRKSFLEAILSSVVLDGEPSSSWVR